jgi:hypothetical protein
MPCSRVSCLLATIAGLMSLPADLAARQDGQTIGSQASRPEVCTMIYQPVCGTNKQGKRVTYSNACVARVADATNVKPGECSR